MKEQILIRVGKGCNYKCKFCNVADINEKTIGAKENYKELIEQFHKKLRVANITNLDVTITGGEPSLFKKEVYFIISYILKYCSEKNIQALIEMQTNATLFTPNFASWLVKHQVDNFLISFHTADKDSFEKLLGVSYDQYFHKVIQNIHLLQSYPGIYISLNVILTKINYHTYLDTIRFLIQEFQGIEIELGVVQPNGYGELNISELYMDYQDIYRKYNYALFLIKKSIGDVVSHYCGLPLCYMMKPSFSLERKVNLELRQEKVLQDKFLINKLNDASKVQGKECSMCMFNNVCSGIWKNYIGKQRLIPSLYMIDFFNNFERNHFACKLFSENQDLSKLYHQGMRQIIIPSSLGDTDTIYSLVKASVQQGFYKISLLVSSGFHCTSDIFSTGVSNIQIDISDITLDFLDTAIEFSSLYKPQFRIDIDIFISQYNPSTLDTLEKIVKRFPNNFVKLFFIYDYNNKDIYEYIEFLDRNKIYTKNIYTVNFYKPLLYKKIF